MCAEKGPTFSSQIPGGSLLRLRVTWAKPGRRMQGRVRVSIDLLSPLSRSSHPLSHTFVLGGQISSDEFNHPAANGYDNLCPHLVFIKFALPLFISVALLNFLASFHHISLAPVINSGTSSNKEAVQSRSCVLQVLL